LTIKNDYAGFIEKEYYDLYDLDETITLKWIMLGNAIVNLILLINFSKLYYKQEWSDFESEEDEEKSQQQKVKEGTDNSDQPSKRG
jgi:hypothetical protein